MNKSAMHVLFTLFAVIISLYTSSALGVLIATKPDAPINAVATPGNANATVAFTAPANKGTSPITLYTVTSSPDSINGTCTTTNCTVTGLTSGTAYTFTVTATNSVGTSMPSVASNSVTPGTNAIQEKKDSNAILNKNFGAGIFANFDFANGGARVKSASVVGGVVRVGETTKTQVKFMLEAHKFTSDPVTNFSKAFFGPFIGLIIQGPVIDTAVLGVMWGIKQPKSDKTLNIGVGISVSPQAQVLGDGIVEGSALPNGETEVRFKRITKYGLSITTSFGF